MENSKINSNNFPIFQEEFLSNDLENNIQVEVYEHFLKIIFLNNENKSEIKYDMKDIIGCYIQKPYAYNDQKVNLTINVFPKKDGNKRQKVCLHLIYDKYNKKSINVEKVLNLKKLIDRFTENQDSRPFLVFLNPSSGSGKASKLMFYQVVSLWKLANVKFKIIETSIFFLNVLNFNRKLTFIRLSKSC